MKNDKRCLGYMQFPQDQRDAYAVLFFVTGAILGFSVISFLLLFAIERDNAIKNEGCLNTRDRHKQLGWNRTSRALEAWLVTQT